MAPTQLPARWPPLHFVPGLRLAIKEPEARSVEIHGRAGSNPRSVIQRLSKSGQMSESQPSGLMP